MFRQLQRILLPAFGGVDALAADAVLTSYRPSQLSEYLESYWASVRNGARQAAFGAIAQAAHRAMARTDIIDPLAPAGAALLPPRIPPAAPQPVAWHHLIYAALLEQSRLPDILRRVVFEWTHGERLPVAQQATQRWLHVTEQLFFANSWPFSVGAVTSNLRPDSGAVRRNSYWRMFGWDCPGEDGRPYSYVRAESANREFSSVLEALLQEVWYGHINRTNFLSERRTDNTAILELVRRLQEMLLARRFGGLLSREEFWAVAMASWCHLTVEYGNTAVLTNLNAPAGGIADRVKRIGALVGVPAHARCDSFFQLAGPMSRILLEIENGNITAAGAPSLYAAGGFYTNDMLQIITHWSVATGRNIKDAVLRQPLGVVLQTQGLPVQRALPGVSVTQ